MIKNITPDLHLISTVNRIDNTRVVTRICCKFQTKFLSGICRRSIAEYITAGRVFAKSVQTFCIVLFSKFSINVKTYILKGRTDRDHILVIIIWKCSSNDHRLFCWNFITSRNRNVLFCAIGFLPCKSTIVDDGMSRLVKKLFIRPKI